MNRVWCELYKQSSDRAGPLPYYRKVVAAPLFVLAKYWTSAAKWETGMTNVKPFSIEVGLLNDLQDLSFCCLDLRHSGCGQLRITMGVLNAFWRIYCATCGSSITIPQYGIAEREISRHAIRHRQRQDISGHVTAGAERCLLLSRSWAASLQMAASSSIWYTTDFSACDVSKQPDRHRVP